MLLLHLCGRPPGCRSVEGRALPNDVHSKNFDLSAVCSAIMTGLDVRIVRPTTHIFLWNCAVFEVLDWYRTLASYMLYDLVKPYYCLMIYHTDHNFAVDKFSLAIMPSGVSTFGFDDAYLRIFHWLLWSRASQGSYPAGWQAASHGGALWNPSFSQPPQRRGELNCFFIFWMPASTPLQLASDSSFGLKKNRGAAYH